MISCLESLWHNLAQREVLFFCDWTASLLRPLLTCESGMQVRLVLWARGKGETTGTQADCWQL